MIAFILNRIAQGVAVIFAVIVILFLALFQLGDPAILFSDPRTLGQDEAMAAIRLEYGLDEPVWVQFTNFISKMVTGDFGESWAYQEPTLQVILSRLPATIELVICTFLISTLIGLTVGVWVGLKRDGALSKASMAMASIGYSIPTFWLGLMFIVVFAASLNWLPAFGRGETVSVVGVPFSFLTIDGLKHLLLPVLTLTVYEASIIMRLTASATTEVKQLDFMQFARARGLKPVRLYGHHLLRSISIPILTVTALEFASLVAFTVVTETVFGWPGIGKLIVDAIQVGDRPMIIAYLVLVAVLFTVVNILVDVISQFLDPRLRDQGGAR